MLNIPKNNFGDIVTTVAAFLGAITGSIAFIWKILEHFKFELEVYSHFLSADYIEKASKALFKITREDVDISKYSDNAIVFNGWFKLLLRMEGKRYRNHHIDSFTLEPKKKLKKLLKQIAAESSSNIAMFCNAKDDTPELSPGLHKEIEAHSNKIFLKAGWENKVDNPDQTMEKINELIGEKHYSINIQLTTYKYPFTYVKDKNHFFRQERFIIRFMNVLRRFLRI